MEQKVITLNIEPDYDNIVSSLSNVNVSEVVLVQEMINNFRISVIFAKMVKLVYKLHTFI